MKTAVNPFSVRWTKRFPLILNGVLEIVLVCAQFSSKLSMVPKVYALLVIKIVWNNFDCFSIFMPKLCSGGYLERYRTTAV